MSNEYNGAPTRNSRALTEVDAEENVTAVRVDGPKKAVAVGTTAGDQLPAAFQLDDPGLVLHVALCACTLVSITHSMVMANRPHLHHQ